MKRIVIMLLAILTLYSDSSKKIQTHSLVGTWYIADNLSYGIGSLEETTNRQIIFDEDKYRYMKNGKENIASLSRDITIPYSVDGNTLKIEDESIAYNLIFKDITYDMTYHTDYSVTLVTDDYRSGMILVKSDEVINDISELLGSWNVTYEGDTYIKDKSIQFNDDHTLDITNHGEESSSTYLYVDNILEMPEVNMKVLVFKIDDHKVLMVEEKGEVLVLER